MNLTGPETPTEEVCEVLTGVYVNPWKLFVNRMQLQTLDPNIDGVMDW